MSRVVNAKTEELAAAIVQSKPIMKRFRERWPELANAERIKPPYILTGGLSVVLPRMGRVGQITVGIHYFLNDPEFRSMVMKIAMRL